MTRFRLTVSTEYEVHEDHYYTKVVKEQLALDQASAEVDPWGMLQVGDTGLKVVVEDITPKPIEWIDSNGEQGNRVNAKVDTTEPQTYDNRGVLPTGVTNVKLFKADL